MTAVDIQKDILHEEKWVPLINMRPTQEDQRDSGQKCLS